MINTQILKGNLIRQDYTTAFILNQGDKGVPFKVELIDNGTPYTLLDTDIVCIEWLKPNGSAYLQDGNITYGTDYVEFITPEAVSQFSGSGSFNIIISDENTRKGTIRREYQVVPTSFKPGSVSEDVITDAITELRELNAEISETLKGGSLSDYAKKTDLQSEVNTINSYLEDITKKPKSTNNYIHISFDDVEYCIQNIINNKDSFTSIFQDAFFNFLKELHETYGAVFSLYIYKISQLSNFPDKFKSEFIANSKWLKFGLHEKTTDSYETATSTKGKEDWDFFITEMYRITGGLNSIDRIPRLNMFKGSKESLLAMRDCDCGALGFLSADDSRDTYYLNETQREYLRTHDKLEDITNGLVFYSTDMRLDWFNSDFSSTNEYNTPVKTTPYEELVYRYNQPSMGDCYSSLIVFTHEWELYGTSYTLNSKKSRVEDVCKFGVDYGYAFDYPQNRCNFGIDSLRLSYLSILSFVNNGGYIACNFEQGTYALNTDTSGNIIGFRYEEGTARIRSKEFVECTSGTFTINDTTKYNISIIECSDNINTSYLTGGTSWVSTYTIQNSNCKYVKILLKKLDGTNFTTDELSNALTLFKYTK